MQDAPGHRAEQPLAQEQEGADGDQQQGQHDDGQQRDHEARDDAQVTPRDRQLGLEQLRMGGREALCARPHAADGLSHARRIVRPRRRAAPAAASGPSVVLSGAGRVDIGLGCFGLSAQLDPRFRSTDGSPAAV